MTHRFLLATVSIALLATPSLAEAYVQTVTCLPSGPFACRPGEVPKPVRWPTRCVGYYVNDQFTDDIASDQETLVAIQSSFANWSGVDGSEFVMEYFGLTNEDRAEHEGSRGDSGNANVVMWRDDDWPYASKTAFAITSVTFDPSSGLIADADVEFNSENHRFTVGDRLVLVDVENTLTHEAGHFLGLDHTTVQAATMFGSAPEGETEKRSLHPDDIEGLLAAYPPLGLSTACPEAPEYFDKPAGSGKEDKGCCATASSPAPTPWLALLALVGATVLRRRRH